MADNESRQSGEEACGSTSDLSAPKNGELLFPEAIEVLSVSCPPTYQYAIADVGIDNTALLSQTSCGVDLSEVPRTTSFQLGYA